MMLRRLRREERFQASLDSRVSLFSGKKNRDKVGREREMGEIPVLERLQEVFSNFKSCHEEKVVYFTQLQRPESGTMFN